MTKTIKNYIEMCDRCCRCDYKLKSPNEPLTPITVVAEPWYKVGMDLCQPKFPSSGFKYILTVTDYFTKFIEARPLKYKSAEETAKGLFSIYNRQGAPIEVISDNGRESINSTMKELQRTYNCKMLLLAPYHPQTNGLDESSNKTIKRYLMKMLDTKRENWHDYLEQVVFSINIRKRPSTGFSAFELMRGLRKARTPIEANTLSEVCFEDTAYLWGKSNPKSIMIEDNIEQYCESLRNAKKSSFPKALDNITKTQKEMKRCYDSKLNKKSQMPLNIGDKILVWNSRKERMQPGTNVEDPWIGPFEVVKVKLHIVYIRKNNKIQRVKRKFIKKHSQVRVKREKEHSHMNLQEEPNLGMSVGKT